jgi:hypothetical protein
MIRTGKGVKVEINVETRRNGHLREWPQLLDSFDAR